VTRQRADVLGVIDANGPLTADDVSYHLPISSSAARSLIARLEAANLIRVYTNIGRARAYVSTEAGRVALAQEFGS